MVSNEVIDWSEAMQQCGDDEEFLRELLADLRSETETQVNAIEAIIENPQNDPFHQIMRAAHVIKGAAANLMCQQLRMTAMALEDASRAAHESGGNGADAVKLAFANMKQAEQKFRAYLQSAGV